MGRIVLYDQTNFNGNWKQFEYDVPDLAVDMFVKTAKSLKVEGDHWVAYQGNNFTGEFVVYGPGDHDQLGSMNEQIVSLRLVREKLGNPNIVLYQDVNFNGQSRDVEEEVGDLKKGGFPALVSSHRVKEGVWLLYEGVRYTGNRLITFKGDQWANYIQFSWNDKLSSLKPLKSSDFEV
ncbi:epidermal differentiation-specific protein-like [Scyliorhinus canicula]|uniref:epidermal differentiation-specific protein-like n=1 Tax=Scyliorhinus canicula TaxID=7830 RepID=UPI0018F33910|nr:epidermal differentiation-specific protein-like [Scyliorhinus canicula]